MQVEAIPMLINGDFLNAPLDVKMHLADYKMYGEDSYVFQQKELLHGLYECTYLSMNDRRINGEAFEYLTANNKHIGKALSNVYDIEQKEELSTLTTMAAVAASSTAMEAVASSSMAMQAVLASSTAMQAVLNSSDAKNRIAKSAIALAEICKSREASLYFKNSFHSYRHDILLTLLNSPQYFSKLDTEWYHYGDKAGSTIKVAGDNTIVIPKSMWCYYNRGGYGQLFNGSDQSKIKEIENMSQDYEYLINDIVSFRGMYFRGGPYVRTYAFVFTIKEE